MLCRLLLLLAVVAGEAAASCSLQPPITQVSQRLHINYWNSAMIFNFGAEFTFFWQDSQTSATLSQI
jgi:hypothetical protein